MTPPPAASEADRKAQGLAMAGVAMVMLGCTFGGGVAVVLNLIGQKTAAGAVAIVAGIIVLAGVIMQSIGFKRLKASKKGGA